VGRGIEGKESYKKRLKTALISLPGRADTPVVKRMV